MDLMTLATKVAAGEDMTDIIRDHSGRHSGRDVIRDVASQLPLRAVRTERHGNPTARPHAAPPAHSVAKGVTLHHGHATPRHTVPAMVLRTILCGAQLLQRVW
jgi:hypothetical protein